jgi:protein-L-isoaspartate(D-aspartate) O-methyltransferase
VAYVDFLTPIHTATKRDYVGRVTEFPKAEAAKIAKQWGYDYWDGDRHYGYGGYHYDGRWLPVAEQMAAYYGLKAGDRVLDVGCGKAFLLYELTQAVPGLEVAGIDVSEYGIEHAKEEVRPYLQVASATELPFEDSSFDYVFSLQVFHNLHVFDLEKVLKEVVRVSKDKAYICVESYRTEEEKANLLYWQLTCESFYTPQEWEWWYDRTGYAGDHSFIYFE